MSRKFFGTDGIRGKVGVEPITPDFILKLGWAGCAYRKPEQIVGQPVKKVFPVSLD